MWKLCWIYSDGGKIILMIAVVFFSWFTGFWWRTGRWKIINVIYLVCSFNFIYDFCELSINETFWSFLSQTNGTTWKRNKSCWTFLTSSTLTNWHFARSCRSRQMTIFIDTIIFKTVFHRIISVVRLHTLPFQTETSACHDDELWRFFLSVKPAWR